MEVQFGSRTGVLLDETLRVLPFLNNWSRNIKIIVNAFERE